MKKSAQTTITAILLSAVIAAGATLSVLSDNKGSAQSGSNPGSRKAVSESSRDSSKLIALTFDDGPSSKVTPRILDLLEEYDAKATFFVIGCNVSNNAKVLARAYSMGCEIGNHTFDHKRLTSLSPSAIRNELAKADNAVFDVISAHPDYLRVPCCRYNDSVKKAAEMPIVLWSIDTRDWSYGAKRNGNTEQNRQRIIDMVLNNAKDGEIVLMHDIYTITADSCETIIPELCEAGYKLVTVSELFDAKGIKPENGKIYYRAG